MEWKKIRGVYEGRGEVPQWTIKNFDYKHMKERRRHARKETNWRTEKRKLEEEE